MASIGKIFSVARTVGQMRARTFLIVLGVILAMWLGIRACNSLTAPVQNKVYYLARKSTIYPLEFTGVERNVAAFTDDLIAAVGKAMNLTIDIVVVQVSDEMRVLNDEYYDAVLTALLPTPINQENYAFSDPLIRLGPVLVLKSTSTITSLKQLAGQIVGVDTGFLGLHEVQKIPNIVLIQYDSISTALDNLMNDNINAAVIDAWPAYVFTLSFYKDKLKVVTAPLTPEGIRVVARIEEEHFIEQFNQGLEEIRKNGTYQRLIDKWGLVDPEKAEMTDNG